jgi:HTH-type transcriptional regulator / antitoxin HipB
MVEVDYIIRTPEQLCPIFTGFRKSRALSQSQLAQQLGVSQQTISQLERNPSKATLARLLKALSAMDVELVLRQRPSPPITDGDGVTRANLVARADRTATSTQKW